MFLSRTLIALFVTLGIHSWFCDNVCCNHVTCDAYQFSKKKPLACPTSIYTVDGNLMPILHLFYPLVTPISFKICSSTCFLVTKFVNYE